MTDNSTIQQARNVLKKWRDKNDASPWYFDGHETVWGGDDFSVATMTSFDSDAHLIVGTAGNPDILDAIDAMLAEAAADIDQYGSKPDGLWNGHKRIAAAIVAADERMTS